MYPFLSKLLTPALIKEI